MSDLGVLFFIFIIYLTVIRPMFRNTAPRKRREQMRREPPTPPVQRNPPVHKDGEYVDYEEVKNEQK